MNPKRRIWLRRTQMWPIDIALAALGVALLIAWAVAGAPVPPPLGAVPTPALTVGALSAPVGQPRSITGSAAPSTRLILLEDSASLNAATTADAAGHFVFDLPPASTPGPWNISVYAEADLTQLNLFSSFSSFSSFSPLSSLAPRWTSAPILVQGEALPLPTLTATPTATPTRTPSPTRTPASTLTPTPTATPSPLPSLSPSPLPAVAPSSTNIPAATPTETVVVAPEPPTPTSQPTSEPTPDGSIPVTDTFTALGNTTPLLPESGATPTQSLDPASTPTSTF